MSGQEWLRAQAQAQKAAARTRSGQKEAEAKKQAEAISEAISKLVQTVREQQVRLNRLAVFSATQTARIVELRTGWRADWHRGDELQRKLNAALRQLQEDYTGQPLLWAVTNEHPDGMWGVVSNDGGGQPNLPALTEVMPVVPLVHPNGEVTEGLGQTGPKIETHPPGDNGSTASEKQVHQVVKKRAAAKRPAKKATPAKKAPTKRPVKGVTQLEAHDNGA